ncbi:MAG: helix-turn-helix domain-containing protein [Spirochaetaceae bacterium]
MTRVQQLIARNLRSARKACGITQVDLAERCGISASFVSEVEAARKYPSAEVLERLADALEIRPYQLLFDEGDWEVRDRVETVTSMYRDMKDRLNCALDDSLREHLG